MSEIGLNLTPDQGGGRDSIGLSTGWGPGPPEEHPSDNPQQDDSAYVSRSSDNPPEGGVSQQSSVEGHGERSGDVQEGPLEGGVSGDGGAHLGVSRSAEGSGQPSGEIGSHANEAGECMYCVVVSCHPYTEPKNFGLWIIFFLYNISCIKFPVFYLYM